MEHKNITKFLSVALGFSFFLTMDSFSRWGFTTVTHSAFGDFGQDSWNTPLLISCIFTFFLYHVLSLAFPKFFNRAPFLESVICMATGMIFLFSHFLSNSIAFLILASVLIGVATSCCLICWETALSLSTKQLAQSQIIAGSLLSVVLVGIHFLLNQAYLLIYFSFLILLNLLMLFFSIRNQMNENKDLLFPTTSLSKDYLKSIFTISWMPLLCIVMIGIISPMLVSLSTYSQFPSFSRVLTVLLANFFGAVVLGLVWFIFKRKTTITTTYTVIFPLLITSLFLFPFLKLEHRPIILFVGSIGFIIFSIVMMISCIDLAKENSLSLVTIYSLFAGVTYASRFLGEGLHLLIINTMPSEEAQITASVFLLLYGSSVVMFLLARRNRARADSSLSKPINILEEKSRLLSEKHNLTERQTDVLNLLVHGYDVPSIAEKLKISENTVRTHLKNIYTILEIHSKKELLDLIH